jgi:hypothetical protein
LFILTPPSVRDKLGHYEVISVLGQGGMGESTARTMPSATSLGWLSRRAVAGFDRLLTAEILMEQRGGMDPEVVELSS